MIGTVVAPVWPPHRRRLGDGRRGRPRSDFSARSTRRATSPGGSASWASGPRRGPDRLGLRTSSLVAEDPRGNQKRIAETFREACNIAEDHGERLAAEGEICWGGMHSWQRMVQLLEMVDRPQDARLPGRHGPHAACTCWATTPRKTPILPQDFDWEDTETFDEAYDKLTDALRPWTIDFHIAQNDGTVHGSGSHDKTGRHCLADDPNGKLDIPRARRLLAPRREGRADQAHPPHLLGRLHVPQRRHDEARDVEQHPPGDGRRARCARVAGVAIVAAERQDVNSRGWSAATPIGIKLSRSPGGVRR